VIRLLLLSLLTACATAPCVPETRIEYRWVQPPQFTFLQCVETIPGSPHPGFVGRVVSRVPPDKWRVSDGEAAVEIEDKWLKARQRPGDVCRRE
jgi:hypothetical protein